MKATGISLYRVIVPILLDRVCARGDDVRLRPALSARRQPQAGSAAQRNQGQARRALFCGPDHEWVFGGQPARRAGSDFLLRIFRFRRTIALPISPSSSSSRTISAVRAASLPPTPWDPQQHNGSSNKGWERTFQDGTIASYTDFQVSHVFPEITEPPGYFKKEDLQSSEMTLLGAGPLYSRPQPERLRHHALARAVEQESRLSRWSRWSWRSWRFPSRCPWAGEDR